MGKGNDKYFSKIKDLFEEIYNEMADDFNLDGKPKILVDDNEKTGSVPYGDLSVLAYYSRYDKNIHISKSTISKYKKGKLNEDVIRYILKHEMVHVLREKDGLSHKEEHDYDYIWINEYLSYYNEIKDPYEKEFRRLIDHMAEEMIADLYGFSDTEDMSYMISRIMKISKNIMRNKERYKKISDFFEKMNELLNYLKSRSNEKEMIILKSLNDQKDLQKRKELINEVLASYKEAFGKEPYKVSENTSGIKISDYAIKSDELDVLGYFIGTLAAIGYKSSGYDKNYLRKLVMEKDKIRLLDEILNLAEKGRKTLENYIEKFKEKGYVSGKTYNIAMQYLSLLDYFPFKKKYYKEFLYVTVLLFLGYSSIFFNRGTTGFLALGISGIALSSIIVFISLISLFLTIKR